MSMYMIYQNTHVNIDLYYIYPYCKSKFLHGFLNSNGDWGKFAFYHSFGNFLFF